MTDRPDAVTALAREHARGLLAEAAEEARALARADLVGTLRRAIVDEAMRHTSPSPPAETKPGQAGTTPTETDPTPATGPATPAEAPAATTDDAQPERCLYAYAIADRADLDFAELNGSGDSLRCIDSDGLALVVAEMDVTELAGLQTDEITEDGPLARLARTHDEVVRVAAGQATVLPLRLGTAVADDEAARELLRSRGDTARRQLDELRGRREWGVQFLSNDTQPTTPEPVQSAEPPSGTAYLTQRRAALEAEERYRRDRTAAIEQAHDQLSATSSASVRRSTNAGALADMAYLIAAADEAAFQAQLEQLAQPLSHAGVSVRVTGPWPPYSFVSSEED